MAIFKAIAKKESDDSYTVGCIDGLMMIFNHEGAAQHVFDQLDDDQKEEMEVIDVFVGRPE